MGRIKNRRKHGASSLKSHLKQTTLIMITSKSEASLLLLKRTNRPVETSDEGSSVLRDSKTELQRERMQDNKQKYSLVNLKVDRKRSAVQAQIQTQNYEGFAMEAEVVAAEVLCSWAL